MKKNNGLAILFGLLLGGSAAPLCAQESGEWSMTVGTDAVSSYLWRGMNLAGPSIQPSVYFDYEKGDWAVSLGTWASKSFVKGDYNEWDLSIEATWRNITLSLANYREYYGAAFDDNYLDLGVSLTLSEDIPVTFSWYSIVNHLDGGMWDGGNHFHWADAFPSYFEIAYDFSLAEIDFTAAAALLPFASDYYGNEEFGPCNLSITAGYEFEFDNDATLPVSAQVMYNPMWRECFWGLSVGYYFSVDL